MSTQIKKVLTLEDILEVCRQLNVRKKSESKLTIGERKVFAGVVYGSYDKYKDEMSEIINEDIEFLNKEEAEFQAIKANELLT